MARKDGKISRLSGTYEDGIIRVGDEYFRNLAKKANKLFEMDEEKDLP